MNFKLNIRSIAIAMILGFFILMSANVSAQSSPDFSGVSWKSNAELTQVLSSEHQKWVNSLTIIGLQQEDVLLYNAFKRMIEFLQTDIAANKPMSEAIQIAYKSIMDQRDTDVPFKGFDITYFDSGFIPGLIETLSATPVVVPTSAQ